MNKISDEKKLFIRYLMYGDLIKKYIEEELFRLNKSLTIEQTISVINKALELDEITEIAISNIIIRMLKK